MNVIVKQLAQQAGMYVDLKGEPWPKWMGAEECELAYAKFAELIVKECIETLRLVPYNSDREFGDEVIYQDAVKQHFGVEE
jgi:hypothetical protein